MIKNIISLVVLLFTTAAFSQNQYTIAGTALGFKDSTVLYLQIIGEKNKTLDSTYVIKNKFYFTGELKAEIERAIIKTKDYSDYKFLWLEKNAITFNAQKGKFREALIAGSKTQDKQNELDLSLKNVSEKKRIILEKEFVKNNPNSIISAYILSVYSSSWGKDITTEMYNSFNEAIKNTPYGKSIFEFISLNRNLKIGDTYVDFSQENTEGKQVKLSDFKNKVVLLEFWGSWCGPCRESNPDLVKIYNDYKSKGFEIFGIGNETSKELWLKAIKEDALTWTNVTDLKGSKNEVSLIYGVSYFPTNFLIDKNGKIIARDVNGNKLKNILNRLLN